MNLKLYEFYQDTLSYKNYLKILKRNMVCVSEIYLLNKLLEENRISKEEYLTNALNPKEYIKGLYINKKISKEEYYSSIILPNKFGAVSLASKTNATIVPCAVTGKYKILNNNLTIKFGTPFKVENITILEEYRQKLEKEIVKLILDHEQ